MAGSSGLWGDARTRGWRSSGSEWRRSGGVRAKARRPCSGRPKKLRLEKLQRKQRVIDAVVTPVVGSADRALQRCDMSHATVNRREFLKTGAAAGASLVIGLYLPAFDPRAPHAQAAPGPFKPNAWIEIAPDGAVTIWTGRSEMGQGVRTAMPMIVAEELEADWARVRVAPAGGPAAQVALRVPSARPPHAAPGHAGQGERRGDLRRRRAGPRHGVRRRGALSGVRRTREDVRPRPGPCRAGSAARGPDLER